MSRLRTQAAQAIVDAVAPFLPNDITVRALSESPTQFSQYPALVAMPQRFKKRWWYEAPVCDENRDPVLDDLGRVLMLVGSDEGSIQLRAYARDAITRENIEDGVNSAFNQTSGQPGVLTVTVTDAVIAGGTVPIDLVVSAKLKGDEWREERVFSERRMEYHDTDATIGIYVPREVTPDGDNAIVTKIIICLSEDTTTDISQIPDPADRLAALEPLDTLEVT